MSSPLLLAAMFLAVATGFAQDQPARPLKVMPNVDLNRYAGTWYEIARMPFKYQSQCAGDVTATYTLLDDGTIRVVNRCRKENGDTDEAVGKARLADTDGPNTKLKVRFAPAFLSWLPFVWGDYWIIDLASDYSYSVVGEPGRRYMWILSRTPAMEEGVFQGILERAKEQGYDVTKLLRTRHSER